MNKPPYSPKQWEVIKYNWIKKPLITLCEGAVRSGKTQVLLPLWVDHVYNFRDRGVRFIMTGTTVPSLKRNVLDELNTIFNVDTALNVSNEFMMFGNIISCFGAAKADSYKPMKGFTAYGWLGNEVTEHHPNTIDQAFKRCSGEGFRIFMDTNPDNPLHPIKTDYVDKDGELLADGREHIKVWHFNLDDNIYLPDEYRDHLKKITPSGHYYDRDILGLWVSAEGMIYKDFAYDRHTIGEAETKDIDFKEHFAGVDWGYDHKGVIGVYGTDHDGNHYRRFEIVKREKSISWWIGKALEIVAELGHIPFYPDPARPDYVDEFRKAGLYTVEAENAVVPGIGFVAEQFKTNKIKIVRERNKNYLSEVYTYRWDNNARQEQPIKENDDSMDSERYAMYSHCGKPRVVTPAESIYR